MSSHGILSRSAHVVLSFIRPVCINAHCDTVPPSYVLRAENVSISTELPVVSHHLSDTENPLRLTRCAFISPTTVNAQK